MKTDMNSTTAGMKPASRTTGIPRALRTAAAGVGRAAAVAALVAIGGCAGVPLDRPAAAAAPGPGVIVNTAPPPQRTERPSPPPFSDAVWVAGHWTWLAGEFEWIPGQWVQARRGYSWSPYRWQKLDDGRWQLTGGSWVRPSIADPLTRY